MTGGARSVPSTYKGNKVVCEGYLEGVFYRSIYGWAWDRSRPEHRLSVQIAANGAAIGVAVADRMRPDLAAAGYGDGRHGFILRSPVSLERITSLSANLLETGESLPLIATSLLGGHALPEEWSAESGAYRLPNFLILGAAKSGTTSLHGYLARHPGICMSNPKEPPFFECEYELGATYYYSRYFSHWRGEKAVGEARHRNLYLPYVPARIHSYNPSAKLIAILRNPVERTVSHWWHWHCRETDRLPFREALEADLRSIESAGGYTPDRYAEGLNLGEPGPRRTYLDSGYYAEQLERYLELFGPEQLKVILFDDLVSCPGKVMQDLLGFLGVDSGSARAMDFAPLNQSKPGMYAHTDRETLEWLVQHYRPWNARLSDLLHRPLPAWDQPFQDARR